MDPLENVYSGWAGDFSAAYSRVSEAPRAFYFFSALTCLGVMISDKITVPSRIYPQPRLYTVLLGESATDKKSTAIRETVGVFKEAFGDDFQVCHGVGSAEGLMEQFKEGNRLLLCWDELKAFVSKAKIEGSVLLQAINSLYESNRYQSRTKKHSINLDNVHLSMLGASTLETYSNIFNTAFLDIGLPNRLSIIKASGQRKWPIPPIVDNSEKVRIIERLKQLVNVVAETYRTNRQIIPIKRKNQEDIDRRRPLFVNLSTEAGEMFEAWYYELPRTESVKRIDVLGHRLIPLMAVNEGTIERDRFTIGADTMRRIIDILKYEQITREECDPIDSDNRIAALEERIRRQLKNRGPLSKRELRRHVHGDRFGIWMFNRALCNLLSEADVKFNSKTKNYELIDVTKFVATSK
ncbi:MAG: DUF3987 domain-containing protein [Candidatus Hodarchaeota archaeon]